MHSSSPHNHPPITSQTPRSTVAAQRSNAERLRSLFSNIRKRKATGRLSLVCPPHRWYIFFDLGECVYATGSYHRIRRWNRALQLGAPGLDMPSPTGKLQQPWEFHLLTGAIYHDVLSVDDGITIAMVALREILFAVIASPEMTWHWQNTQPLESAYTLGFVLEVEKINALLEENIRLHRQWTSLDLDVNYVNCAPIIQGPIGEQHTKSGVFSSVHDLLDGQHSFWDLALVSPAPLAITTRILHHFLQQDILTFEPLPDLAIPSYLLHRTSEPQICPDPNAPLIACIDDSEQVCRLMEKIITGAGYRFLGISNSLEALPLLLEHKPSFIFLDLVMPVIGGYELCKQLRRAPAFQATPITILTGRDSMIARLKSNMVGATDFLNKPLESDVLLHMLEQHFGLEQSHEDLTTIAVETAIKAEKAEQSASNVHVA